LSLISQRFSALRWKVLNDINKTWFRPFGGKILARPNCLAIGQGRVRSRPKTEPSFPRLELSRTFFNRTAKRASGLPSGSRPAARDQRPFINPELA
jgi:hypothetical protein